MSDLPNDGLSNNESSNDEPPSDSPSHDEFSSSAGAENVAGDIPEATRERALAARVDVLDQGCRRVAVGGGAARQQAERTDEADGHGALDTPAHPPAGNPSHAATMAPAKAKSTMHTFFQV